MMKFREEKQVQYPYDYRINENDFSLSSQPIGKLPKIKLTLPKISISENIELKIA